MHPLFALVVLIGFAAQLVDGSMGMGYGVTSSTLLLLAGFAPATVSATVHLAEVASTVASGLAHRRLGNVDPRLVLALALPGAAGAFAGATFLSSVPGERIKPWVSAALLALGLSIVYRFARQWPQARPSRPLSAAVLLLLGLVGGFCDAAGGGGWGSIVTATLLARPAAAPAVVIGSVSMSEVAVTLAATAGFAWTLGTRAFALPWVAALVTGGVVAAPLAAWLVRRLARQPLGIMVGGTVALTNLRTLMRWSGAEPWLAWGSYAAVLFVTLWALLRVSGRPEATRDPQPVGIPVPTRRPGPA